MLEPKHLVPLALDVAIFWVVAKKLRKRGIKIVGRLKNV